MNDKSKKTNQLLDMLSLNSSSHTYKLFILFAGITHILYGVLFFIAKLYPLSILNIFSSLLYVLLFKAFKMKRLQPILIIINAELLIHIIMVVYFLGWAYNFHMFVFVIIPVALLSSFNYKRKLYNLRIASIQFIIMMLTLSIVGMHSMLNPPVYQLTTKIANIFFLINIFNIGLACIASFSILLAFISDVNCTNLKLDSINNELSFIATHDPLTNLINRRSMNEQFSIAIEQYNDKKVPFSIILADIDDFKKVNDIYGHDSGDIVLKRISKIIQEVVADNGAVCRWGGEEILILTYNGKEKAIKVAEQIRSNVQSTSFVFNNTYIKTTLTLGVAEYKADTPINKIITQADANLYKGKKSTKNCVIS